MDLFLTKCLDFIALEGSQGIDLLIEENKIIIRNWIHNKIRTIKKTHHTSGTTLEALWAYMAKEEPNQVHDEYIKTYVWDLLQQQAELQIKVWQNFLQLLF